MSRIEILRSTAERNRPDDSAECIVDGDARERRAIAPANLAMPCRGLQGPRAR